jgi:hypothetical protein
VGTIQSQGLAGESNSNSSSPSSGMQNAAFAGGNGTALGQVLSQKYPTYEIGIQLTLVEKARYEAGIDRAFFVIQYQAYLSQARSTEVVATGNYFKAQVGLSRCPG